jgi:DNA-binding transcriptional MerR regulator
MRLQLRRIQRKREKGRPGQEIKRRLDSLEEGKAKIGQSRSLYKKRDAHAACNTYTHRHRLHR